MSLAIDKFSARCRVPPRVGLTAEFFERVVRQGFATECAHRLNLLPAVPPAVVRVRVLPLKIELPSGKLDEDTLAKLCAVEFIRVLSLLLTNGAIDKNNVVHIQTRTEWLARFISDLLSGSAQSKWEYDEFADVFKLGTVEAVFTVLQREPRELIPVLQLLATERRLDRLLLLFGDFAFEQLFAMIARAQSKTIVELTIDKLLKVGLMVTSDSAVSGVLATRHRALRIFLALTKSNQDVSSFHWSPRLVFHALMALDILVDITQTLPTTMWVDQLTPESLTQTGRSLNPTVLALLEQVRSLAAERDARTREQRLAPLTELLHSLAHHVIEKTELKSDSYWLSGECAGLLLLVGLINRFRWHQRLLETSLGRKWGPRAVLCCFAGLGQHLLGKALESNDLDPGVAVFAGWLKPASADTSLVRTVLSSASDEDRLEVINALDVSTGTVEEAIFSDWTKTFEYLGNNILREFATRVRGFRKATPAFVVNTFLKQAGRICIDDKRIFVLLQPNPFHVALHLSSVDEPVDSVGWLDNRRLEFQLEGL